MRELLRVRRHRDQTCSAPSLFWRMFSPCKDNEGLRGHRLSKEVMSFRKRPLQFFWASLGASSRRLMLITSRLTSSSSDGLSDLFQVSALGYLLYEIPVDITFQDEWPGCVRRDCVCSCLCACHSPRRHCPKPKYQPLLLLLRLSLTLHSCYHLIARALRLPQYNVHEVDGICQRTAQRSNFKFHSAAD